MSARRLGKMMNLVKLNASKIVQLCQIWRFWSVITSILLQSLHNSFDRLVKWINWLCLAKEKQKILFLWISTARMGAGDLSFAQSSRQKLWMRCTGVLISLAIEKSSICYISQRESLTTSITIPLMTHLSCIMHRAVMHWGLIWWAQLFRSLPSWKRWRKERTRRRPNYNQRFTLKRAGRPFFTSARRFSLALGSSDSSQWGYWRGILPLEARR